MKRNEESMKIKVAGLPGTKTQLTLLNIEEALIEVDQAAKLEWISDAYEMCRHGATQTPSLFINDVLKMSGRIPSVYEVKKWLEEAGRN